MLVGIIWYPLAHTSAASVDCTARGVAVDLHGCDLRNADLHDLDLSRANLTNAILTGANVAGTDLQHASLTGVVSGLLRGQPQAQPVNPRTIKRVLFIGNSYTAFNNLPDIFNHVVTSAGITAPAITAVTPGGQNFKGHLTFVATQNAINAGNWDVVVLQDQSQEPAFAEIDSQNRADMLQGAATLSQRIRLKSPNARIFFYETWARHAAYWSGNQSHGEGANPREMQSRLRKWYGIAAQQNQATVVAVGDAWEAQYARADAIRLHDGDNSHPVWVGSYLAALMMYGTIYGVTQPTIAWHGTLHTSVAQTMQLVATSILGANAPTGLPAGWKLRAGYLVGPGANLTNADLRDTNLAGVDLSNATLTNTVWGNTVCPDGSNSDSRGGSCQAALATQTSTPTATRTATQTRTNSRTATWTRTATATRTHTVTRSATNSRTSTWTRTATTTRTPTNSHTATLTHTPSLTQTPLLTPSQ